MCLTGCLRLVLWALWRAVLAAVLAMLYARIDDYVERRFGDRAAGRIYRRWRGTRKVRRGTPPDAGSAIETRGRPS
jgi:hypothetical protein